MSDNPTVVDELTVIRAMAASREAKASRKRVSQDTILSVITKFLNDDKLLIQVVTSTYEPGKSLSSIMAAFRKTIKDSNLSELVLPNVRNDEVELVKMFDPKVETVDDDDNVDETGVIVESN